MDIENFRENKKVVAFSDTTIEESFQRINLYKQRVSPERFSLDELTKNVDPDLLNELGDMLEETSNENILPNMCDNEIFIFNEDIYDKVRGWEIRLKEVLNVTLIKKILDNLEYTNRNIDKKLLGLIYRENHTDDLMYIWFSTFREKLRNQEEK